MQHQIFVVKSFQQQQLLSQAETRAGAGGEGLGDRDEVRVWRQLPEAEERPEHGQPGLQHRGQLLPRVLAQTEATGDFIYKSENYSRPAC